jgi:hypothetical protein
MQMDNNILITLWALSFELHENVVWTLKDQRKNVDSYALFLKNGNFIIIKFSLDDRVGHKLA